VVKIELYGSTTAVETLNLVIRIENKIHLERNNLPVELDKQQIQV